MCSLQKDFLKVVTCILKTFKIIECLEVLSRDEVVQVIYAEESVSVRAELFGGGKHLNVAHFLFL